MRAANRVVMNTGVLYARMAITVFISLYATRLVLNALGVTDFGTFNVVAGAISLFTFLNNAMAGATLRFMSYAEGAGDFEKLKSIFNVSVILHLIIAILILLILEIAGYFLFNGILKIPEDRMGAAKLVYQFMIVSTFFTVISVPYDASINAHENMLLFAVLGVLEAVLKLVIAIYITYTHFDKLIAYGVLMAASGMAILLLKRIYCVKKYSECRINLGMYFSKPIFRDMIGFAGWSLLGSSSKMISNYGQGIVMNMFFGTVVNAAQGIAAQVSGQLGAFAVTMQKALNPMIGKSEGGGDRQLMLKATMTGSKVSFFLLILFYIPVFIEMPFIFNLWLKDVPEYAIVFCRLLLLRNLVEQLYITLNASIAVVGNIRNFQIATSILNFLPLVVTYVLFTYSYPPYTLYIVFFVYSTISSFVTFYFAHKLCGLPVFIYFKDVVFRCALILFIVFMIACLPTFIINDGLGRLVLVTAISLIFLFVLIWGIGLSKSEKALVKNIGVTLLKRLPLNLKA